MKTGTTAQERLSQLQQQQQQFRETTEAGGGDTQEQHLGYVSASLCGKRIGGFGNSSIVSLDRGLRHRTSAFSTQNPLWLKLWHKTCSKAWWKGDTTKKTVHSQSLHCTPFKIFGVGNQRVATDAQDRFISECITVLNIV